MIADLHELLVSSGLSRVADVIERHARPSIRLTAHAVEDEDTLPLGASKLGGSPDLPPDYEWPRHDYFPLSFVTQINLADVAPYDPWAILPHEGMLYFFFDKDYGFRVQANDKRIVIYNRDDPAIW